MIECIEVIHNPDTGKPMVKVQTVEWKIRLYNNITWSTAKRLTELQFSHRTMIWVFENLGPIYSVWNSITLVRIKREKLKQDD